MTKRRNRTHPEISLLALAVLAVILLVILYQGGCWQEKPETRGDYRQRYAYEEQVRIDGTAYCYRRDLTTLLLLGVDNDDVMETSGYRGGNQADFLWLIVVDNADKKVTQIQLDRDTMADVQLYGPFGDKAGAKNMQICLAYAYGDGVEGKCDNVADAVSRLFSGITVNGTIALDMGGIAAFNDALGGVTVTLESDLTSLGATLEEGKTVTLSGEQAEAFVRGRRGVDDGTNHARMRRQRIYMDAAETQMRKKIVRDQEFLGMLLDGLASHYFSSISRGWLINIFKACFRYDMWETQSLAGEYRIGEDGFMEFHVEEKALQALLIQTFLKPVEN